MKLSSAVQLLRLLPTRPEDALTVNQILERYCEHTTAEIHVRSVQRYMSELSADSVDGPALVDLVEEGRERRYYLRLSQVAQWFMTEAASLDLLLARQVLLRSFGTVDPEGAERIYAMAEKLTADSAKNSRLYDRLRVVPDGIGRQQARIDPKVLAALIEAIRANQMIAFTYARQDGKQSEHVRAPLGLVAKDGTIYLLATKHTSDSPVHFAVHRFVDARMASLPAPPRPDFDLDRYIVDTQQFSHVLGDRSTLLQLELRVAPEAVWHFRERPFPQQEPIDLPREPGAWYRVKAMVPDTMLLVPFLLSMGPYIEVIGPDSVRRETSKRLRDAAARYAAH